MAAKRRNRPGLISQSAKSDGEGFQLALTCKTELWHTWRPKDKRSRPHVDTRWHWALTGLVIEPGRRKANLKFGRKYHPPIVHLTFSPSEPGMIGGFNGAKTKAAALAEALDFAKRWGIRVYGHTFVVDGRGGKLVKRK